MSGPFGSTAWMANPASGFYDFEISNSLRFEDGDSAYLTRTPSSAGNLKTWTWSCWIKFGNVNHNTTLFSSGADGNNKTRLKFDDNGGRLFFDNEASNSSNQRFYSTGLFRDPSSWYNIVVAVDTTQGTNTNRVKIYANGTQITVFAQSDYPAEDLTYNMNTTNPVEIGKQVGGSDYWDGYMADVNFIDGLQLTPSSFGETKNDIWIPKNTSGLTFGSQGFRLQFKQSGTGTASTSTIGADTSGNNNHLTSANLVASDVVPDSPTNNFATLNPLDAAANCVISEGNLKYTTDHSAQTLLKGNFNLTNKHYWEVSVPGVTGDASAGDVGIANPSALSKNGGYATWADNTLIYTSHNGNKSDGFGGSSASYGATYTTGDIVGIAVDVPSGTIQFFKNNASQGTITDSTITTQGNTNTLLPVLANNSTSGSRSFIANFGQDSSFAGTKTAQGNQDGNGIGDFYYAPPSGFLALCTSNLPDPVETMNPAEGGSVQDYFNTVLYNGNGSTQGITGVGFQPDWVWLKNRDTDDSHAWTDSVRGVTKELNSDARPVEATNADGLTAFGTDGFSLGDDVIYNTNSEKYVAWNWKVDTAFSNDASSTGVGSIDSVGRVNTDAGISIVTYTGTGSNATVAHGLGVAPDMVILMGRNITYSSGVGGDRLVWHNSLAGTERIYLNETNATETSAATWNSTVPSSTVVSIGTNLHSNYNDTSTYIIYSFAEVEGYSKIGKYTGNGSTDGPFVYTGFRPAFVMLKRTDSTGGWHMHDNKRNTGNLTETMVVLSANFNDAEYAHVNYQTDFLSNGFKLRNTTTEWNADGGTFIFMAFAEQPFKYANAR